MSLTPQVFGSFEGAIRDCGKALRNYGQEIKARKWQGVSAPAPMLELLGPSFRAPMNDNINKLVEDIQPNLPWADLHFAERVSRDPSNPGESWKEWPYYPKNGLDKIIRAGEQFTHTYQERIWPKFAGDNWGSDTMLGEGPAQGIRYFYGDLDDVIKQLEQDPLTRQAFLPIWFPEDTGAVHGGRVPCTLGYLFIQRKGYLHCTYYIRSCDYFRHFRDDIYLAARLALWVNEQLGSPWSMGFLTMRIDSLHCWLTERNILPSI